MAKRNNQAEIIFSLQYIRQVLIQGGRCYD